MRTEWHDIWGGARGRVQLLSPRARIVCGACVFAACLAAPAASPAGVAFILAAVVIWGAFVRPPAEVVRGALIFGLILFLPYFLLAPVIRMEGAGVGWREALLPPWKVFIRGLAGMQVSIATVSSLTASDLRSGLLSLPVPGVVSAVLIQIVHQTAVLFYETRRIASAIAVRGGTSGPGTAVRVMGSLPRVWLPRILDRVERVAAAMEMRGYAGFDLGTMDEDEEHTHDLYALVTAFTLLVSAFALRFLGGA
jgi:energy-coupling factor transporter transmembrane protein EcfT